MSEAEDFKAGQESRASVLARAARSTGGTTDVVQHMVEAALYRQAHRVEPELSTEDRDR